MKSLIEYFLERKFLVDLISIFLWLVGGFVAWNLNRDLVPQFQSQDIRVGFTLPGASALDVESLVAGPAEGVLYDLPNLKKISSTSYNGYCEINLEYPSGFKKLNEQVNDIRNRLSSLMYQLPPDTREPSIQIRQNTSAWFLSIGLLGIDPANLEHRRFVAELKQKITSLPGVVGSGEDLARMEFLIRLLPEKLERFGIKTNQVSQALREEILGIPVTNLAVSGESISVELAGKSYSPKDFDSILIKRAEFGPPVYLRDVAVVSPYVQPFSGISLIEGKPYSTLWFRKSLGSDILKLQKEAEQVITEINKPENLPAGLTLKILGDGASFVGKQLDVLYSNAWIGALLVVLILAYFLGRRAALMTAIGVPTSYFGTALVLEYLGININLISVIALILVVGILVDDAIVISERYCELLREGKDKKTAAKEAALSMLGPVTAGITTTLIAFTPILFVGGWLTNVLFSIPVVIISSLAVSWLEAFFILPSHLYHYVGQTPPQRNSLKFLKKVYEKCLGLTLKFRYLSLLSILAVIGSTGWLAIKKLKTNFDLSIGNREVSVDIALKDSTSFENTLNTLKPLSDFFENKKKTVGIDEIYLSIGRVWMDGKLKKGPRYANFSLSFRPDNPRAQALEKQLLKELQNEIAPYKTDKFERLSVQTSLQGSDGSEELDQMFSIYFRGNQPLSYQTIVDSIQTTAKDLNGLVGVSFENDAIGESLEFVPDFRKLSTQGITERDLATGLRHALNKEDLGQIFWQGESFPIGMTTFWPLNDPWNFKEQISSRKIQNSLGQFVPLSELGTWVQKKSQNQWFRENRTKSFSVNVKFDETKVRAEDFKSSLVAKIPLLEGKFPGYEISAEEANKQIKENKLWIYKTLLYCLGGIFFVLALQLQSFFQPLLICSSILFGFTGAIWALVLHGYKLEILGMVGLLGVAGIAVNDSVILVDHINRIRRGSDKKLKDFIISASSSRLQAILMTSLTTLGGLFPMAYGIGGDSGFTQPMAFSMAWGLLSGSFLTLFFIPVFLLVTEDVTMGSKNFFNKFQRSKKNFQTIEASTPTELVLQP